MTDNDPREGLPLTTPSKWDVAKAVMVILFCIGMGLNLLLAIRLWESSDWHADERRQYQQSNRDAEFCEQFATDAVEWRRCIDVRTDGLR